MRVLFLQDHRETGGAARAANRVAAAVRKQGVEVAVAAGDHGGGPACYLVTGKPRRGWGRVRELFQNAEFKKRGRAKRAEKTWREALEDFRPDLVWVHNLHGGGKWGWSEAMVAAIPAPTPVLWTLHDMWPVGQGRAFFPENDLPGEYPGSPVAREFGRRPRLILTSPSRWLEKRVCAVHPGACVHLPYVLELESFRPEAREARRASLGLGPRDILLLAAAENLADPRKRIPVLIEAWQKIRNEMPDRRLRLGLLGRNAPRTGEEDCLTLGLVSDHETLASFFAAADLFLHVSEAESIGQVLEEAQACGTPVMTVLAGGTGETLEQGVTGWGLPDARPETLASGLRGALARPEVLAAMRKPARELMQARHGGGRFSAQWAEVVGRLQSGL